MFHVSTGPHPRRAPNLSRNPSLSLNAVAMEDVQEFQESTTIKFEWTLRGLKQLFESRCGHFRFPPHTDRIPPRDLCAAWIVADSSHFIAVVGGKQSPRSPRASSSGEASGRSCSMQILASQEPPLPELMKLRRMREMRMDSFLCTSRVK